ncbi:LytR/AlgR family response regulator transcription factor [Dyadobacter psychrotolerans]|uniref:Response regulator transcription factor n=1 Tax=Dyadobacter psychrotolerans TaxID=2541721 RepID=A0A4R5DKQ2_9BACT|nr:LytTR family DNA-binding domain-containing protein [Dyadobacter psychrotolerans]TDE14766.1 response regulator transcription factor [Dyadobacter psychrotolerans]
MEDQMKNAVTCMIVDDEKPAHQVLNQYIDRVPGLSPIEGAYLGLDALDKIPILKPDILFLDVEMPDLSGLRVLDLLKTLTASVILTTAHQNFAVDGYGYAVKGFLLKPIYFEEFISTVYRVRQQREIINNSAFMPVQPVLTGFEIDLESGDDSQGKFPVFHKDTMIVKVDGRIVQIPYADVTFVEGAKNYVKIYIGDIVRYCRIPISVMMSRLPSSLFITTNRSFIVNRLAFIEMEGNEMLMNNNYRVKVSKDLRALVLAKLTFNG